jgi:hypothetical protein
MEASQAPALAGVEPLLTLDGLATCLAISRRTAERMKSSGKLPPPDLKINRMPRWRPQTLRAWIDEQAERGGRQGVGR